MQRLVFESPVKGVPNELAHQVCEACGPYAAKHDSEALSRHIQSVTTEVALEELRALVCGVCSLQTSCATGLRAHGVQTQDRWRVFDILDGAESRGCNVESIAEIFGCGAR